MLGKCLWVCFICIESAAIAQSICRENFCTLLKTAKLFSRLAFVIYGTHIDDALQSIVAIA